MSDIKYRLPADIERASMEIIRSELTARKIILDPVHEPIILRVIHTTADFDYAKTLTFTPGAVERGISALAAGADIVTDTNMARAGISKPALAKLGGELFCYMADPEVAAAAKSEGVTRAAVSMRKAAQEHPDAILAVGNAPTALLELCALMENGLRPPLVIGVPVGFVNVIESKRRLLELCRRCGVPAVVALGRKGGSNVAAAICNALLSPFWIRCPLTGAFTHCLSAASCTASAAARH